MESYARLLGRAPQRDAWISADSNKTFRKHVQIFRSGMAVVKSQALFSLRESREERAESGNPVIARKPPPSVTKSPRRPLPRPTLPNGREGVPS